MEVERATRLIDSDTKKQSIVGFFTDYIIYVFQGTLSQFDILVMYKRDGICVALQGKFIG